MFWDTTLRTKPTQGELREVKMHCDVTCFSKFTLIPSNPNFGSCPFVTSSVLIYSCFSRCLYFIIVNFLFQIPKFFYFSLMICRTAVESQNHRMVLVGRNLGDHLIPTPLSWAGTPSSRPDCSELHPGWP